jgi:glucosamine-6-phosphate deaminase
MYQDVLTVFDSPEQVAVAVVKELQKLLQMKPTARLLFPTGLTPIPIYQEIVARVKSGVMSLDNATIFNLDEYCDPKPEDSYRHFMETHLFSHLKNQPVWYLPDKVSFPTAQTHEQIAEQYAQLLNESQIDFALIGIGQNGHVAFNEPGLTYEAYHTPVHVVELSESTRTVNKVPYTHAITVGIKTISQATRIIMVATGASKSEIVCKFMNYDRGDEVLPVHRICPEYMSLICDRAAVSDYIQTKELKITQKSGRVLVFSPHPDDDVIGMGGTISKYAQNGVIVDVCYMTGGQNKTRVQEAVKALEVLCGDHHTAHFLDLPFYSRVDRKITKEDHQTLTNFLSQCLDYTDKYLAVYVCGDLRDPSDTHKNCYTILTNVVRMWLSTQLQDLLRENTPWYVYFSVWYTPDLYKYVSHLSHVEMSEDECLKKRESIQCHQSQLRINMKPEHMAHIDEFWSYIEARNRSHGRFYNNTATEIFVDFTYWTYELESRK